MRRSGPPAAAHSARTRSRGVASGAAQPLAQRRRQMDRVPGGARERGHARLVRRSGEQGPQRLRMHPRAVDVGHQHPDAGWQRAEAGAQARAHPVGPVGGDDLDRGRRAGRAEGGGPRHDQERCAAGRGEARHQRLDERRRIRFGAERQQGLEATHAARRAAGQHETGAHHHALSPRRAARRAAARRARPGCSPRFRRG
jgi:hypothetical protein